jgi:hypothetical protein
MLEAALRRTADKGQSDRQVEAERLRDPGHQESPLHAAPDIETPLEDKERAKSPESLGQEPAGIKKVRFDESQDVVEVDDAIEEETGIPLAMEEEDDETSRPDKRPAEDDLDEEEEDVSRGKRQRLALIAEKQPTMLNLCSQKSQSKLREMVREVEKEMPKIKEVTKNHRQRRSAAQQEAKARPDVAEIYSPPRITKMAQSMGMSTAWALDLTETDPEDGMPWDLSKPEKRRKAMKMLEQDQPLMLIGSPKCGPFSAWQNVNYEKIEDEESRAKVRDGILHWRFTIQMCSSRQQQEGSSS